MLTEITWWRVVMKNVAAKMEICFIQNTRVSKGQLNICWDTDVMSFILKYKYIIFILHIQSNTILTQAYYGTVEKNHLQKNHSQFEHLT